MPRLGGNTADTSIDGSEQLPTLADTYVTTGLVAQGWKGANTASAGTTDIGSLTSTYVHVTGTTTITALGTAAAGAKRIVVFDGALTLTHNASSLILPTAANITTAAGDTAIFISEGSGNWKCVTFLRANGQPLVAGSPTQTIQLACSDETTALTTGTGKITFRMPFAFTLSAVRASLTTAQASGSIFTVDINEGGTTILSTKLTIDNTEKTSTTAATAAVISDVNLADDAEITVDIDQVGDGTAKGLKVTLIGVKP